MEKILLEIMRRLEERETLGKGELEGIIRKANAERAYAASAERGQSAERAQSGGVGCVRGAGVGCVRGAGADGGAGGAPDGDPRNPRPFAKRHLLPFYQRVKAEGGERWKRWGVTSEVERRLVRALQMKPRRSASGVSTISVITKPWGCSNDCLYCPNDITMPKSYICDEPACQRAQQNFFDPYLQVHTRLVALHGMGHPIDKVELIVLGGNWFDYPEEYRFWFVEQMFAAVNDFGQQDAPATATRRRELYGEAGISADADVIRRQTATLQAEVDVGRATFNQAVASLYGSGPACNTAWDSVAQQQRSTIERVLEQHRRNETGAHRVVGLVVETRPDSITPERLCSLRQLGCTKVQIGVQSTRQQILDANGRRATVEQTARAFDLARLFGFKIHAHFMVNLLGATPEDDERDYDEFACGSSFSPDEVKLYPCELVPGTALVERHARGEWVPYSDEELLDVLVHDVLATPAHIRMSRMIRDIPSSHVIAGNKVTNLRQMVDRRIEELGLSGEVLEIRSREISTGDVDVQSLRLDVLGYETRATSERFLQWVTAEGKIAGFLRLSLPREEFVVQLAEDMESGGVPGDATAIASGAATGDVTATAPGGVPHPVTAHCPIAPGEAMIREVHVYGRAAGLHGDDANAQAQHMGLGKALVDRAAQLAAESGFSKLNVISAVGTREYYRKLGFVDKHLYQQLELV